MKKVKKTKKGPTEAKKIVKVEVFEESAADLDSEEVEPVRKTSLPDCLRPEAMAIKEEKVRFERERRKKQLQSFTCPDGWEVVIAIGHGDTEDDYNKSVPKEVTFWQKYRPQYEYKVERPGDLSSVIIRRLLTEEPKKTKGKKVKK